MKISLLDGVNHMKYKITQSSSPVVICTLAENEKLVTESGVSVFGSANIKVHTSSDVRFSRSFAQKAAANKHWGKLYIRCARVGKTLSRLLSGSALFHNIYVSHKGEGTVSFSSHSLGGTVIPLSVSSDSSYIGNKGGFFAAEKGVRLSNYQFKLKDGLLGEGIFLQKLSGCGIAFIEADGPVEKYTLKKNEHLVFDVGLLLAMSDSCTLRTKRRNTLKSALLGGKNMFSTDIVGPGTVYLNV